MRSGSAARLGRALPWLAASLLVAPSSRADFEPPRLRYTWDPSYVPDSAAPPSIADLTHRGLWVGLEETFASIKPKDAITGPQPRSFGWLTRLEAEAGLVRQRWYLGTAMEGAYGKPPGGEAGKFLFGYPELWVRGVFADRVGLAYGGGLSLVVPAWQRRADSPAAVVAEGVRVVRPWDFPAFADNTFSATPFLDARVIDGRVTMQLRQGFTFQGLVAEARIPTANIVSRTTLFLGYQPIEALGLGLEVWEVYFISADIPDYQRAVFALSPSVRLMTRIFQPAFSVIVPFDRPLFDRVQSYWAARLTLGAVFDEVTPAQVERVTR